jgi:hypothetical protein
MPTKAAVLDLARQTTLPAAASEPRTRLAGSKRKRQLSITSRRRRGRQSPPHALLRRPTPARRPRRRGTVQTVLRDIVVYDMRSCFSHRRFALRALALRSPPVFWPPTHEHCQGSNDTKHHANDLFSHLAAMVQTPFTGFDFRCGAPTGNRMSNSLRRFGCAPTRQRYERTGCRNQAARKALDRYIRP